MATDSSQALSRARWRAALQDLGDRLIDRYLGIETARPVRHDDLGFTADDGEYYQASNWVNLVILRDMLRRLDVSARDVFIDFGCGKGQILAMASRYPFGRVIGLDLSAAMIETASRNMERIKGRRRCGAVELVNMNALDYSIPTDLTTAYFYMPFPTPVYEHVVAQLAESAAQHPRPMRIIYLEQGPDDLAVPGRHGFRKVAQRRRMTMYAYGSEAVSGPPSQDPAA